MGVGAPPYSSELSRRPARRRIRQGVVQSDPNITSRDVPVPFLTDAKPSIRGSTIVAVRK